MKYSSRKLYHAKQLLSGAQNVAVAHIMQIGKAVYFQEAYERVI